jgi:hypothetical protein
MGKGTVENEFNTPFGTRSNNPFQTGMPKLVENRWSLTKHDKAVGTVGRKANTAIIRKKGEINIELVGSTKTSIVIYRRITAFSQKTKSIQISQSKNHNDI